MVSELNEALVEQRISKPKRRQICTSFVYSLCNTLDQRWVRIDGQTYFPLLAFSKTFFDIGDSIESVGFATQLTLDGDSDGLSGGDFIRGTSAVDSCFAFFGDTDGDALDGVAEFGQFRTTFGKSPAHPGCNIVFDYDGSGVGVADFGHFCSRFGNLAIRLAPCVY